MKKNHDDTIFDEITHKYYQSIFNYCFVQLACNRQSAEDCTQEVFMILYQKINTLSDLEQIRPWLYKTAGYVIKNYNRVNNKRVTENIDDYANILVHEDNFDEKLDDMQIMNTLSQDEKLFVQHYYIYKTPVTKIAQLLNISEQAVYKRASRIKIKVLKTFNLENQEQQNLDLKKQFT